MSSVAQGPPPSCLTLATMALADDVWRCRHPGDRLPPDPWERGGRLTQRTNHPDASTQTHAQNQPSGTDTLFVFVEAPSRRERPDPAATALLVGKTPGRAAAAEMPRRERNQEDMRALSAGRYCSLHRRSAQSVVNRLEDILRMAILVDGGEDQEVRVCVGRWGHGVARTHHPTIASESSYEMKLIFAGSSATFVGSVEGQPRDRDACSRRNMVRMFELPHVAARVWKEALFAIALWFSPPESHRDKGRWKGSWGATRQGQGPPGVLETEAPRFCSHCEFAILHHCLLQCKT
ncbi:hypothetical protein B0T18DRAFT_484034 [Schizothecium vesticola]|uniref:Uncharacterized protein n=1 Tax=Schizothecium vesticola TaxID=314040 RepID=A0AA40F8M2_9PEZI|nr:hypothetical protein B0T18DRAFT_484034 [Schizothecium vesticola]